MLLVLAAGFLAGSAAGALAGSAAFDLVPQLLAEDGSVYGGGSYAALLLDCSAAHLLTLLFSTSVIGVLLIPAAMAMRGFTLACSAAWLTAAWPGDGWALALAVLALPALFTVPSLFVTAQSGMAFSLRLLGAYTRRAPPMPRRRGDGTRGGGGAYAARRGRGGVFYCADARAAHTKISKLRGGMSLC